MSEIFGDKGDSPVLVIVRGWPGTGKSFLAKRLFGHIHHVEADDFLYKKDGSYHFTPGRSAKSHVACAEKVRELLRGNESVVVANCTATQKGVKEYLKIAYQRGARVSIIECRGTYENVHGVPEPKVTELRYNFWDSRPYLHFVLPVFDGASLFDVPGSAQRVLNCAKHVPKTLTLSRKPDRNIWPASQKDQVRCVVDFLPVAIKSKTQVVDRHGAHPDVFIKSVINGQPVSLLFERRAFAGHASWYLTRIIEIGPKAPTRYNSLKHLSEQQLEKELAIRKEEDKVLRRAVGKDREPLKKRRHHARSKRLKKYSEQRHNDYVKCIGAYGWINGYESVPYVAGFTESGLPEDVAEKLASMVEIIDKLNEPEGGEKLRASATLQYEGVYGD